ncbi:hypothetical protein EVAR_43651_1 [Eumeta japonica]|uniref:Uncharacterized protein n=1 Tax=Eumeta variegata TaxID=151549 RepID=A0A4C1XUZ3_EUMVA|nr:hypothetical protein EVAR_43651_1 [Eumeta japonica]
METMYDHYDEIQLQFECKDDMGVLLSGRNDFESICYKEALSRAHDMLTDYSKSAEQVNFASSSRGDCTTSTTNCGIVSASDHAAPAPSLPTKSSNDSVVNEN